MKHVIEAYSILEDIEPKEFTNYVDAVTYFNTLTNCIGDDGGVELHRFYIHKAVLYRVNKDGSYTQILLYTEPKDVEALIEQYTSYLDEVNEEINWIDEYLEPDGLADLQESKDINTEILARIIRLAKEGNI